MTWHSNSPQLCAWTKPGTDIINAKSINFIRYPNCYPQSSGRQNQLGRPSKH